MPCLGNNAVFVLPDGEITQELQVMTDNIKLLTEVGQAARTWDIFHLLSIDSLGGLVEKSIAVIGLVALGVILTKFLLCQQTHVFLPGVCTK